MQSSSNSGQGGPSGQTSVGNVGQGGTSNQAGHCKPTIALSANWYPPYRLYQIRGTLTCGGSGVSGKTITLTSSKLSYVGALGTVVTREDGSFSMHYKPASTAKPLTTLSAWFLGGPDEGGIASKVVTPQGGPQSSNTASTPQETSNNGNAAQGTSNNGNGRTNTFVFNSPTSSQQSSNTGNAPRGASNKALKWSDSLAADAKSWAEHLAQLGTLKHATGTGQGENLSYRSSSGGPSTISTAQLIQGWISEKNSYNGGPIIKGDQ